MSDLNIFNFACILFFTLIQLTLLMAVCHLLAAKYNIKQHRFLVKYSGSLWILHILVSVESTVLFPISTSIMLYSCRMALDSSSFPDFTQISQSLFASNAISYLVLAFNVASFVELLIIVAVYTIFLQDKGLSGATFWGANTWMSHAAKVLACVFGQLNFVAVPLVRHTSTR